MNDIVAIQAPQADNGFVELSRQGSGRLLKKQILPWGPFVHPGNPLAKVNVDEKFADALIKNFNEKACDIVQVPIVNDTNTHVEDPLRNAGEVISLTKEKDGVYATIDARKHAEDFGKTILGASAYMHLNYGNTKTGKKVGPTLLHVAATNRPYLTDLKEFEEVVALSATADTSVDSPVALIPASTKENTMDLETLLSTLKDEHGIDVADLQEKVALSAQTPDQSEILQALAGVVSAAKGNSGTVALSATDDLTVKDVADAVIELAEERVALSGQVATLVETNQSMVRKAAEDEVDGHVRTGRILPKQRDAMVALSMSDRETYESLLPDDSIVALSESGVTTYETPEDVEAFTQNVDRLAEIANRSVGGKKS